MIGIHIRSERLTDYSAIAEAITLAFDKQPAAGEAALVDCLRHGCEFDPELSLVAEVDGQIAGHILFTPQIIKVKGTSLKAVALAPLSIIPEYQKQGIGGQLIEEGHRRAKAKGFDFAFLLGHSSYYPKFGYQVNMFGTCEISIAFNDIPSCVDSIEERKVMLQDIPQIISMWELSNSDVDLAIFPGHKLIDWISFNTNIHATILLLNGEIAGYIRYAADEPNKIRYFLAKDEASTCAILSHLMTKAAEKQLGKDAKLTLPLHPNSSITQSMIQCPFQSTVQPWDAAMLKILNPECKQIVQYCESLSANGNKIGGLIWPVEFDIC